MAGWSIDRHAGDRAVGDQLAQGLRGVERAGGVDAGEHHPAPVRRRRARRRARSPRRRRSAGGATPAARAPSATAGSASVPSVTSRPGPSLVAAVVGLAGVAVGVDLARDVTSVARRRSTSVTTSTSAPGRLVGRASPASADGRAPRRRGPAHAMAGGRRACTDRQRVASAGRPRCSAGRRSRGVAGGLVAAVASSSVAAPCTPPRPRGPPPASDGERPRPGRADGASDGGARPAVRGPAGRGHGSPRSGAHDRRAARQRTLSTSPPAGVGPRGQAARVAPGRRRAGRGGRGPTAVGLAGQRRVEPPAVQLALGAVAVLAQLDERQRQAPGLVAQVVARGSRAGALVRPSGRGRPARARGRRRELAAWSGAAGARRTSQHRPRRRGGWRRTGSSGPPCAGTAALAPGRRPRPSAVAQSARSSSKPVGRRRRGGRRRGAGTRWCDGPRMPSQKRST